MGALARIGSRLASAIVKAGTATAIPGDRGRWWYRIGEPFAGAWQSNQEESVETVVTYSTVYACVSLIAGDIAKLPIRLVELDRETGLWREASSPAFSPVLRKPNHFQNRIAFVEQWIVSKLLHGAAYVLKERDERGVVTGLYVLDPTRVRILVAPDGSVFYRLAVDELAGVERELTAPASEIIHDCMIPLFHPLVGVSPITACGVAAATGLSISRSSAQFFANGAAPSGVLTAPGAISNETAERLKTAWQERFAQSGGNYGRIAVLGDGLEYSAMSMSAVDAELIDQLKWTAETVCSTFHVPPYMVGVGAVPAYNNVEALNQQYYTQCLQVLIEALELSLDEGLGTVTRDRVYGVELDISALLRMDTATRIKTFAEGVKGGVLKPNEARAQFDLAPVEGGDEVYLQQQNYSLAALAKRDARDDPFSASSASSAPAAAAEEGAEEGAGEGEDEDAAEEVERGLAATAFAAALGITPTRAEELSA